jgi:hypothetical protein
MLILSPEKETDVVARKANNMDIPTRLRMYLPFAEFWLPLPRAFKKEFTLPEKVKRCLPNITDSEFPFWEEFLKLDEPGELTGIAPVADLTTLTRLDTVLMLVEARELAAAQHFVVRQRNCSGKGLKIAAVTPECVQEIEVVMGNLEAAVAKGQEALKR